jgi:N utilization substance protein B
MSTSSGQHQLRSIARRKALQILFQSEVCGYGFESILADGLCIEEVGIPCDFTKLLLQGVDAHMDEIDALIASTSENWSLDRMPLVDRSILRLATFEMLYVNDIPHSVSINEAIELAKNFGGEDESSRFVNGVLGRIASYLNEQASMRQQLGESGAAGGGKVRSRREKKVAHG